MGEKNLYLPEAQNDLFFAFVGNGWLLLAGIVLLAGASWAAWKFFQKRKNKK